MIARGFSVLGEGKSKDLKYSPHKSATLHAVLDAVPFPKPQPQATVNLKLLASKLSDALERVRVNGDAIACASTQGQRPRHTRQFVNHLIKSANAVVCPYQYFGNVLHRIESRRVGWAADREREREGEREAVRVAI